MSAAPVKAPHYVLGLGSNLGDRLGHLRAAVTAIALHPIEIVARSRVYRTPPLGPPQPEFLNGAVRVATPMPPSELLAVALEVERSLGRRRPDPVRWGPRIIDIDVLWCAEGAIVLEGLTVPHPGLHERSFALRPLLDVAPDAADPASGERYASLPAARAELPVVGPL